VSRALPLILGFWDSHTTQDQDAFDRMTKVGVDDNKKAEGDVNPSVSISPAMNAVSNAGVANNSKEEAISEFEIVRLLQAYRRLDWGDRAKDTQQECRTKDKRAYEAFAAYKKFLEDRAVTCYEDLVKGYVSKRCIFTAFVVLFLQYGLSYYVVLHSIIDYKSTSTDIVPFAARLLVAVAIVGNVSSKFIVLVEKVWYRMKFLRAANARSLPTYIFWYSFMLFQGFNVLFVSAASATVCFNFGNVRST
jgi:hypothetical protein